MPWTRFAEIVAGGACASLRETDGAHVDPEDAPTVLDWLLDRLI